MIARRKHELEEIQRGGRLKSWLYKMNPVGLVRPLSVLFPTGPGSSPRLRLNLMLLAATDSILFGVGIGGMTVIILFAGVKFKWGDFEVYINNLFQKGGLGRSRKLTIPKVLNLSLDRQLRPRNHALRYPPSRRNLLPPQPFPL